MPRSVRPPEDQFARIAPYYDPLMASVPYARWADYVSDLALLASRPILPGSDVLDLATGTGSVALEFADRGCEVTGFDLSEPMLEQAAQQGGPTGRSRRVPRQRDLADFTLPAEFDFAVCLYDSLNYILDPDDLKQAFANIRHALQAERRLRVRREHRACAGGRAVHPGQPARAPRCGTAGGASTTADKRPDRAR